MPGQEYNFFLNVISKINRLVESSFGNSTAHQPEMLKFRISLSLV